jgi:hypothetical protein
MPRRRHHDPEVLALMAAHGQILGSENAVIRGFGLLYVSGLLRERLSVLSDQAIGNLLFDFVWDELSMHSPTGVIVQDATARLWRSQRTKHATSFRDTFKL